MNILGLTGIATYAETYGAEIVSCDVVEHVVLTEEDGRAVLISGVVQIEFGEAGIVHLSHLAGRGQ